MTLSMCVFTCIHAHTCMCEHMYVHVCISMHAHVCKSCVCVCICTCMCCVHGGVLLRKKSHAWYLTRPAVSLGNSSPIGGFERGHRHGQLVLTSANWGRECTQKQCQLKDFVLTSSMGWKGASLPWGGATLQTKFGLLQGCLS